MAQPLSDDELGAVINSGDRGLLEKLSDEELQRSARLLIRKPQGDISRQAESRLASMPQTPEPQGVISEAVSGFGAELSKAAGQIPTLGRRIFSGEVAEDILPSPKMTGERAQRRADVSAGTMERPSAAESAQKMIRYLTPGTQESRGTIQFLNAIPEIAVDIAESTAKNIVKTLSMPGTQLEEHPGQALMAVADLAAIGGGAKFLAGKIKPAAALDEIPANLSQSPIASASAMPAVDDAVAVLDDAVEVAARTGDDASARLSADLRDRLERIKSKLAENVSPAAETGMDEIAASAKAMAADEAVELQAVKQAMRKGELGEIDRTLATRMGVAGLGATVGAAAAPEDETLAGAFLGGVGGLAGVKFWTDPKFRDGLARALSLKKKGDQSWEPLFQSIIEPHLPDAFLTGERLPAIGAIGGGAVGGVLGGRPEGAVFDPASAMMGAAIGAGAGGGMGGRVREPLRATGGINPRQSFRRVFLEDRGLPEEVAKQRINTLNRMAGSVEEIIDLSRKIDKLSPENKGLVDQFIREKIGPGALPEDTLDLAVAWRHTMDNLSLGLVEQGLAQGRAAQTIVDNLGTYVPRLFLHHERSDSLGKVAHYLQSRGENLSKLSDLSYLKKRKDLPAEVRKALGEISSEFGNASPGYLLAKRGTTTAADVEFARYTNWLSSSPEYVLPKADDLGSARSFSGPGGRPHVEINGQRYRKMADNRRLGHLRDRYVQEDIAYDLESMTQVPGNIFDQIQKLGVSAFKFSKIAANPASQVRNIIGGVISADVIGGVSPHRVDKYVKALRDYRKGSPMYHEARSGGLFGGTYYGTEVQEMIESIGRSGNVIGGMGNLARKAGDVASKVGRFGRASEDALKMVVYRSAREAGSTSEAAVELAQRSIFDYRRVPRWVQVYRSHFLGAPFVSFSYKSIPRYFEHAVAIGDPKKMLRFWKYPLMFGAVNEMSARKLGFRAGDEFVNTMGRIVRDGLGFGSKDLFKHYFPDYVGSNQVLLPSRDQFGRQRFLDLTWMLPWGDITETGSGVLGKRLAKAGIPFPRQIEPGNPWLQTFLMAATGRDLFNDREIYPKGSDELENLEVLARTLSRLWMPSLAPPAGYGYSKLRRAFGDEAVKTDPFLPSRSDALMSEVLGVKIRTLDPALARARAASATRREMSEIKSEIRRMFISGADPSLIERRKAMLREKAMEFQEKYGAQE